MNDADFLQGLRDQNPAAIQHLTTCYLPSVWRFVHFRVNGDSHLAEDIVGDAVLALLRAAATDVTIQNPGAWLRVVAGNKVQDHFRAAARVQHLVQEVGRREPRAEVQDAAAHQEQQEQRHEIRRVLDDLSDRDRLVLEWKYVDKASVRDIAARLGVSEKAAESILFRARRDFRQRLQGIAEAGPERREPSPPHEERQDMNWERPAKENSRS